MLMEEDMESLSFYTVSDSCEGMCKRVLNDIKGLSDEELIEMIYNDCRHGGRSYESIVTLGEKIKSVYKMISMRR